jgi:hypothetical protein
MTDEAVRHRRFARTVRVALHTALAEYELSRDGRADRHQATFLALAARGTGDWRFPEGGIAAADGLLTARLERDGAGRPARLTFQADGAAGLDAWAGRPTLVVIAGGEGLVVVFDRAGRAVLDLTPLAVAETDLSDFALRVIDGS